MVVCLQPLTRKHRHRVSKFIEVRVGLEDKMKKKK